MDKPKNIPVAATWNAAYNQWESGESNAAGQQIGIWNAWSEEGLLCSTIDFGDGTPPYLFKRFHPDGTLARQGNWLGDDVWTGTYRWIKSENPTGEPFPAGIARECPDVWIAEFDFIAEGIYNSQRYFDKQNNPVTAAGKAMPERPTSVPIEAHFVHEPSNRWIMLQVDTLKKIYVGDYAEWDINGSPVVKRLYDCETGAFVKEYGYMNGEICMTVLNTLDGFEECYYHRNTSTPLIQQRTCQRGDLVEILQVFIDENEKELYSVREETIKNLRRSRYYNDILVFECIQATAMDQPPVSVRYFYDNGAVLIDYTSNRDGTGTWSLYSKTGRKLLKLREPNESMRNEQGDWDLFMPKWSYYDDVIVQTDWDAIISNFRQMHKSFVK